MPRTSQFQARRVARALLLQEVVRPVLCSSQAQPALGQPHFASQTRPESPQSVALSGTGVVPGAVTVSPTSLAFGSINVGSTAAAQTATLKNGGTSSITITSVSISGTNAADFSISSKTCGTSLAAAASCTMSITFKPAATGARTATLSIVDSAKNSPQTVSLSGTGVAPTGSVTVAPTSLGFANTEPGATSFAQIVTLNNGTKAAITISGIALGGTNPGDFAISSKTCGRP